LSQIVPAAALDDPVRIFAREFLRVRARFRMRRSISITFEGNCGYGDDRTCGKPLFKIIVFRLAFSQSEPPSIVMDYDADVIRRW
jgi:hypothetical protein